MARDIWTDELRQYVVAAYAGTETSPTAGVQRRVFEWEQGDEIKRGNAQAFAQHLGRKFGIEVSEHGTTSAIHRVLRQEGEALYRWHEKDEDREKVEAKPGIYVEPDPEEWTVGKLQKSVTGRLDDLVAGISLMREALDNLEDEIGNIREALGGDR